MSSVIARSDREGLSDREAPSRGTIGPLLGTFFIAAAALSPVVTIWAGNVGQVPKVERLVLIAFAYLALGAVVFWLLHHLTKSSRLAVFLSFFALLALTSGGQVLAGWPWGWRWVAVLIAMAVVSFIVMRLQDRQVLDVLLAALAAALLVPPLVTGISQLVASETAPGPRAPTAIAEMASRPDIVLVILDGYTSLPVLREFFGFEDPELEADLEHSGFSVVEPVFTPYSMTHLTISSLLELDYANEALMEAAAERSIPRLIGGDNRLVHLLGGNGYQTTMVEPGWHMSECGEHIDLCVVDPFVDESVDAVLSQSMFWSFIEPAVGSAFTGGARHAMNWTLDNIAAFEGNGTPDFLFVHVVAPHPPLFLDPECEIVEEDRRRLGEYSEITSVPPAIAQARLRAYSDQVQCVNRFIRRLAGEVAGSEAVVLVTGDHGSDALSQLATPPDRWSNSQVLDRMGTFLALKAPPGCENNSSLVTVSIFRSLVSCSGGLDLDPIEDEAFIVSRAEAGRESAEMRRLDGSDLDELAACMADLEADLTC